MNLFPYQIEGAQFLARTKRALLADRPRVGKTGSAIGGADLIGAEDILELTTASARLDHAKAWRGMQKQKRKVTPIYSESDDIPSSGVIITSWDLACGPLRQKLLWRGFDLVIPDECHKAKNKDTTYAKALYGEKCDGEGGFIEGVDHVWPLSGTPAPNHYGELWTLMHAVMPDTIQGPRGALSERAFMLKFCRVIHTSFGNQFDLQRVAGGKKGAELRNRLSPRMLRRSLSDVAKDHPPLMYDTLEVEADAELTELRGLERDSLVAQLADELKNTPEDKRDIIFARIEASVGMRLRRLTGMAKARPLASWADEQFDAGIEKLVFFAWHEDVVDRFMAASRYKFVKITGKSSPKERDAAKRSFMEDPDTRGIVGQILAAGEAVDLSAADQVVFIEASHVPGHNDQAAHRVVNIMRKRGALARFAVLPGSIDERIQQNYLRKARNLAIVFG